MGKIKRERQKFHIASTVDDDADIPIDTSHEVPTCKPLPLAPMQLDVSENIFAGINIQLDKVHKFSEPKPTPSSTESSTKKSVSTKPTPKFDPSSAGQSERQMTKKEKMKLKHEKLLQKIDVIQQAKQKHDKKNKKKKKKALADHGPPIAKSVNTLLPVIQPSCKPDKKQICDLTSIRKELVSLNDSLPSLNTVFHLKSKDAKTGLEQPMTLKSKQRKQSKTMSKVDSTSIQCSSKTIMKDTKKDAKKEYVKSYDLFRTLLKAAKNTTSNPMKLPKQKKYPKKMLN